MAIIIKEENEANTGCGCLIIIAVAIVVALMCLPSLREWVFGLLK